MDLQYKNIKEILISVFVGFFIGLSIIVPGVSGSTIAIAFKVYDKLMFSISNLFKKFKLAVLFLLPILFGIAIGLLLGLIVVKFFLFHFPYQTICFFVGLMIGTYPIIYSEIKGEKHTKKRVGLFAIGFIVPIILSIIVLVTNNIGSLDNLNFFNYVLFLIIGIMISLTQIVPGLSATALLMIFGYFTPLMDKIGISLFKEFDILLVFVMLVVGFLIGIMLFSKLINNMLEKRRKPFFYLICGLSLASIISVFFGKDCIEIYKTWDSNVFVNILVGIILLALGTSISYLLYLYDKKHNNKEIEEQNQIEN